MQGTAVAQVGGAAYVGKEAVMSESKPVMPITLTLTSWQKRMLLDYLHRNVQKVTIPKLHSPDIKKYRYPPLTALQAGAFNLYLDDRQIQKVKTKLGIDVEFSALNVTPAMIKSKAIIFE